VQVTTELERVCEGKIGLRRSGPSLTPTTSHPSHILASRSLTKLVRSSYPSSVALLRGGIYGEAIRRSISILGHHFPACIVKRGL
jgi:hypothetical protein